MRPDEDPQPLPLVEEFPSIERRRVLTGRFRVRTETEAVEATARAELAGEEVEITRVPINRPIDTAPPVRTEGDVTIFPVLEEVLVVEKRLYLKEEIHLTARRTTETVELPMHLRRQHAVVERLDPATGDLRTETIPTNKDRNHE